MITTIDGALWQWDTGRRVQIVPRPGTTVDKVLCYNATTDNALQLTVDTGDKITVGIPDEFLQESNNITVYAIMLDATGERTTESAMFGVRRKPKPDDYVYTPTERATWERLAERIAQLEENPASGGGTKESIVLADQTTGAYYRLSVADGKLTMEVTTEQSNTAGIHLTDTKTGAKYIVYVSDGLLTMESEV